MLFDLRTAGAASVAPMAGLFLPELHCRRDLDLSLDQVNDLADLCDDYTRQRREINGRMTRLAGALLASVLSGRLVEDDEFDELTSNATGRGTLFGDAESLMISMMSQGYRLLSQDQIDKALTFRRRDASEGYAAINLAMALDRADSVRL